MRRGDGDRRRDGPGGEDAADDAVVWGIPDRQAPARAQAVAGSTTPERSQTAADASTTDTDPTHRAARDRLELVAFVAAVLAGLAVFHWLGDGALSPPPLEPSGWAAWAAAREPAVAAIAVGRLLVLALLWYMVGATALTVVATLARSARLVRVADLLAVPTVRRVARAGLGAGLAVSVVTSSMGSPSQVLSVGSAIAAAEASSEGERDPARAADLDVGGDRRDEARPLPLELAEDGTPQDGLDDAPSLLPTAPLPLQLALPDASIGAPGTAEAREAPEAAEAGADEPGAVVTDRATPSTPAEGPTAAASVDDGPRSDVDRVTPRAGGQVSPPVPRPTGDRAHARVQRPPALELAERSAPGVRDGSTPGVRDRSAPSAARADASDLPTISVPAEDLADTASARPDSPSGVRSPASPIGTVEDEVVVAIGESFWSVAERVVAAASDERPTESDVAAYWHRLIEHNRDRLAVAEDPDLLYPGQVLALPALDEVAP